MKRKHLKHLITHTSETSALFLLLVLYLLRLKRAIPSLRPRHIIIPATIVQIIVFIHAALHPSTLLIVAALGNLIVVGIALIPSTYVRPLKAHWVKPYYE